MRLLNNKDENEDELEIDESIKQFTPSLKDFLMMATMYSSILVGFSMIVAYYFKIGDVIVLAMIICSWLISVIVILIKYYNFTVIRDGYNITITYGIFLKKKKTIQVKQIQSLTIIEGIIKKPLGYFSIKVQTIGYGKEKGEYLLICPIAKMKVLNKFVENILPEMNINYDLRTSPGKALNGFVLFKLFEATIIIGLVANCIPYGYYIFCITPILFVWYNLIYKDNGLYYGNDFVVMRYRKLNRNTVIICKSCIQSFEKEQNIFQKKKAVAKYKVTIASDSLGKSYKVGYISENSLS